MSNVLNRSRRTRNASAGSLAFCAAAIALVSVPATAKSVSPPEGARYVAMGSSYASGPGVTLSADNPPTRCQRSADNYAHQLARKRKLLLTDVSCGGATTANLLGPWGELPAQLDAITPDTALVTVTIGGNDVGFAGGLIGASCEADVPSNEVPAMCAGIRAALRSNSPAASALLGSPDEAAWARVGAGMDRIAQEVRRRAPGARVIFVDYIRVLPDSALCAAAPLSAEAADRARATALRLARITAETARRAGAGLVRASDLSRGHEVCRKEPWVTGFTAPAGSTNFVPYHPNLTAMTAIADALDRQLAH